MPNLWKENTEKISIFCPHPSAPPGPEAAQAGPVLFPQIHPEMLNTSALHTPLRSSGKWQRSDEWLAWQQEKENLQPLVLSGQLVDLPGGDAGSSSLSAGEMALHSLLCVHEYNVKDYMPSF